MGLLGRIFFSLGADITDFEKKLDRGAKKSDEFSNQLISHAKKAAAAVTAVFSVAMVKAAASSVVELGHVADQSRVATEELGRLRYAAQQVANVGDKTFDASLRTMTQRIAEAADGTGKAAGQLKAMGVDAQALARLKPDEQFRKIADAVKGLDTRGQQLRATVALFGNEGAPLVKLFDHGSEAINRFGEEADRLGLTINRIDVQKVADASDAVSASQAAMSGVLQRIAIQFAPLVSDLAGRFLDLFKRTNGFTNELQFAFDVGMNGAAALADGVHGLRIGWESLVAVAQTLRWGFTQAFADIFAAYTVMADGLTSGVNATIRGMNRVFRTSIKELPKLGESEFAAGVKEAADNARIDMTDAWRKVGDKLNEPLPSTALRAWVAQAQKNADDAAAAYVATLEALDNADESTARKIDQKERDRASQRLDAMRKAQQDEFAQQWDKYAQELEILNTARANEVLTETAWHAELEAAYERHLETMGKLAQKHGDERSKFTSMSWDKQAADIFSTAANITAGVSRENRKLFEINKLAGIGNAIMYMYEGIAGVLAKYPGPLGWGMATLQAAAGLAQVNAIKNASFGSGGAAPSLAGSTAAPPVSNVASQQEQRLVIEGVDPNRLFTGQSVRDLAERLREYYADGGAQVRFA